MKFNKWTVGLAAIGVVSLASAARADEQMSRVQTALSNTTISGYVSASFNWAMSPGGNGYQNSPAAGIPYQGSYTGDGSTTKQDGFNLDVVKLSISKPQDESPWAAGYQVDLLFGPDAANYNTSVNAIGGNGNWTGFGNHPTADFAIKQAYIALRTPLGNGIDWKVGVFDSPIGYESFDAGNDPNYTRSWGNAIEPTELTGVLASYKFCDEFSLSAGIANTLAAGINRRAQPYYSTGDINTDESKAWHKAFLGSATFTAPSSWGWAAGSSLYAGIVYGFNGTPENTDPSFHQGGNQINYYAGATMNTPWKQLTAGAAIDYAHNLGGGYDSNGIDEPVYSEEVNVLAVGLYATVKATDKLSFNARGEYVYGEDHYNRYYNTASDDGFELTGTVEYDLWVNVISRLELRWDHSSHAHMDFLGGGELDHGTSVGFYANVIYKF